MTTKNPSFQRWDLRHDPDKRPLGCNGRYGNSGIQAHKAKGDTPCQKCRDSYNHYRRELQRGQNKPRKLQPCGTRGAAQRHRNKGEALCYPCKVAEANSRASYRKEKP